MQGGGGRNAMVANNSQGKFGPKKDDGGRAAGISDKQSRSPANEESSGGALQRIIDASQILGGGVVYYVRPGSTTQRGKYLS